MNYDPKLRMIKPNIGISMRFPTTGEPQNKYYEENRKSLIDATNRRYENGWLPDGPMGWWIFRVRTSSDPVPPLPEIMLMVQGSTRKVTWDD